MCENHRQYGEWPTIWKIQGFIPGTGKNFSILQSLQTGSGSHPAHCSIGTVFFFRVK